MLKPRISDPGIREREIDAAVPFCATTPLRVLDTLRSPASDRRWSEDERLCYRVVIFAPSAMTPSFALREKPPTSPA
jgi:hypothetical protein